MSFYWTSETAKTCLVRRRGRSAPTPERLDQTGACHSQNRVAEGAAEEIAVERILRDQAERPRHARCDLRGRHAGAAEIEGGAEQIGLRRMRVRLRRAAPALPARRDRICPQRRAPSRQTRCCAAICTARFLGS